MYVVAHGSHSLWQAVFDIAHSFRKPPGDVNNFHYVSIFRLFYKIYKSKAWHRMTKFKARYPENLKLIPIRLTLIFSGCTYSNSVITAFISETGNRHDIYG